METILGRTKHWLEDNYYFDVGNIIHAMSQVPIPSLLILYLGSFNCDTVTCVICSMQLNKFYQLNAGHIYLSWAILQDRKF